jgi:DNA-binding MarR family transcriptional regulator
MNAIRDVVYPNGEWRNKEGRPKGSGTKEYLIKEYLLENPASTPTEIARNLGISRTTVYKYLK